MFIRYALSNIRDYLGGGIICLLHNKIAVCGHDYIKMIYTDRSIICFIGTDGNSIVITKNGITYTYEIDYKVELCDQFKLDKVSYCSKDNSRGVFININSGDIKVLTNTYNSCKVIFDEETQTDKLEPYDRTYTTLDITNNGKNLNECVYNDP